VTGVTETFGFSPSLTADLQQVNLICAIAPLLGGASQKIRHGPSDSHKNPHNRVGPPPESAPVPPNFLDPPTSRGTKKIALDPAESSAIDDAPYVVGARAWTLLGQDPRRVELRCRTAP